MRLGRGTALLVIVAYTWSWPCVSVSPCSPVSRSEILVAQRALGITCCTMAAPHDKKALSERDICTKYITPAIAAAGWDVHTQILEEYNVTAGEVVVRGRAAGRKQAQFADYVLWHKPGIPLAIVEAKDNNRTVAAGIQQALRYADMIDAPFAFSSNGDAFLMHDRTGRSTPIERTLALDAFPSRDHDEPIFAITIARYPQLGQFSLRPTATPVRWWPLQRALRQCVAPTDQGERGRAVQRAPLGDHDADLGDHHPPILAIVTGRSSRLRSHVTRSDVGGAAWRSRRCVARPPRVQVVRDRSGGQRARPLRASRSLEAFTIFSMS